MSERINAALLVLLCYWPYSLASRQFSVGVLLLVTAVAVFNRPLHLPRLSPLLVAFIVYCVLVIGLQTLGGGMNRYAVSQSNHIVQFVVYYFAFAKIVQGCDWVRIITSTRFLVVAALLSAVYYLYFDRVAAAGNERDLNITTLMLLLGLFIRGRRHAPVGHFLVMLAVTIAGIVTSDRSSVVLILAVIMVLYWLPIPRRLTGPVVGLILLLPIGFYLLIDSQAVVWLYKLDHNAGIRAEFIRGAASLLQTSPLFGVGFGGPYRPINFPYLESHQLLNDWEAVHIVANHHSLFDVALRLGIPAALLFCFGMFRVRDDDASNNRLVPLLSIIAAVGLSFNAVFENQIQLPQFVLIVAMLQCGAMVAHSHTRVDRKAIERGARQEVRGGASS